jgi:mRNA (guanine-N7-)-methyltransferase
VYYIHGNDVRANGFMPFTTAQDEGEKERKEKQRFRYPLLKSVIKLIKPRSIVPDEMSPIRIEFKRFYPTNPADNIFAACGYIMRKVTAGEFEYNTDGLIFTPALFGVGGSRMGEAGELKKITWDYSFKWKPAEFNTVDFLVTTSKNASGQDVVTPVFQEGTNAVSSVQFNQYKTLILRCGFDEKDKGYYVNPCQDVYDDIIPEFKQVEEDKDKNTYKPVQFYPTNPTDPMGGITNIMLKPDDSGVYQMFTEENEVFGDNTIVEFKYYLDRDNLWRWVPLRVRYDKTAELNQGGRNYGNAYHVANSNWHSIHNPITVEMITTGKNIPDEIKDDDVYYNRGSNIGKGNKNLTIGLRDFHNLYVKKMLITRTAKRGETLIDLACGKGGDFPKWIKANLSFVFGIDVAKDNLENRLDGACARYLNFRREFKSMPGALFVNGNSSLNIKSGQAMLNDKAIQITRSVFGLGAKDEKLGKGVMKYYGVGDDGFNVTSCQFAIHYFFENETTFHNFIRNVAECTKLGGYFIGTSYDGKLVFNRLKKKAQGDSIDIYEDGKHIWGITKDYDSDVFENDETSLGYQISVYQESINKTFAEYLVNYDYLNIVMEKYGFKLVTRDEAKAMGLPEGSGLFSELYTMMMKGLKRDKNEYGYAPDMTGYEKEISFLNRYFVYKKVVTVDAQKLMATLIDKSQEDLEYEEKQTASAVKIAKKTISRPRVKKIPKELILVAATEAVDEEPLQEASIAVEVAKKPRKPRTKKAVEFVLEPAQAQASVPPVELVLETSATEKQAKKKTVRRSKAPTNLELVIEE